MSTFAPIVKEIQSIRNNPVLFLLLSEVRRNEVTSVCKYLSGKKFDNLDIILQTPGGQIGPAFQFVKLFRAVANRVNFIIPHYSKSAGTLMCLGGNEIVMTDLSELGPLDTQIMEMQDGTSPDYSSALNGFKALEQIQQHSIETLDIATKLIYTRSGLKMSEAIHLANEFAGITSGTLYSQLNPKKIGEYARALEIGEKYAITVLVRYMNFAPNNALALVNQLVKGYPSHDFVIDYEELVNLGLPAIKADDVLENKMYQLRDILIKNKSMYLELFEWPILPMRPDGIEIAPNIKRGNGITKKKALQ